MWTRTVRKLRLIAALTGERIVAVLDRLVDAEVNRLRQRERQGTERNDTAHDLYVSTQVSIDSSPPPSRSGNLSACCCCAIGATTLP
ncbi:MAG TPA: hypothetical protein VGS80_08090 [Ktedonobacterales bacterium]|nr:hypothetical protein [Ktedonobacterales bacterium]